MSETEKLPDAAGSSSAGASGGGQGDTPAAAPSEREAYFQALRLWIQQAQLYQNISTCFPYYILTFQGLQNSQSSFPLLNNNYQFQGQQWQFPLPNNPPRNAPENRHDVLSPAEVIARHGGYEYVIPPLYKRLLAEFIDFVLLFILKLLVTFIAVDMFDIIDLEKFDIYKIGENFDDYKLAIEITSEILFLEIIYRALVCVYEASCLCSSAGRAGGATRARRCWGCAWSPPPPSCPSSDPGRPSCSTPGGPSPSLSLLHAPYSRTFSSRYSFPCVLYSLSSDTTAPAMICCVELLWLKKTCFHHGEMHRKGVSD
ncbi:unnamed protein product [Plutella xylostella]|uniref:(diamondback moth) hypothetical protein n=1 Tax=Plutella xylostella TaxID=51655 RepID=A0A8S4GDP7_PLUXY|nr:unnamed protein product [Plutella xylostella]